MSKSCPKCNTELKDDARFCFKCGCNLKQYEEQNQAVFCSYCGAKCESGAEFCSDCGAKLDGNGNNSTNIDKVSDWNISDDGFDGWGETLSKFNAVEEANRFVDFTYRKMPNGKIIIEKLLDEYALGVDIPDGVSVIGDSAFEKSGVMSINISNGVTTIGKRAFANCKSLESVNLPKSLIKIDDEAFCGCEKLEIEIPNTVKIVGNNTINGTKTDILKKKAEEEARKKAEAEAKRKVEEEARKKAETEAKRKAEEETRKKAEAEAKHKAEEIKRRAEAEARKKAEAEAKRKAEEIKRRAEEEARKKAEVEAKRKAEEEARKKVEAEAKRKIEEEELKLKAELVKCVVGGSIYFGSYYQRYSFTEPIEWIVLAREGNKALLISKYALDCKKYNEEYKGVTWESCTLRKCLNGEFINSAFTSTERSKILSTTITTSNNPYFGTRGGNSTSDKIFLLSIGEVEKYFSVKEKRKCKPTLYAVSRGTYRKEMLCSWWLRSPGISQGDACYVYIDGNIHTSGDRITTDINSVRPAMWVSIK